MNQLGAAQPHFIRFDFCTWFCWN